MKQISKKLILKKKTVVILNEQELTNIIAGKKPHTKQNGCVYTQGPGTTNGGTRC